MSGKETPSQLARILAVSAVCSIALVVMWRLRHPVADAAVLAVAVSLCILIWSQKGPERK